MRRVVVATDSFKGSLSAVKVVEAISTGIRKAMPGVEVVKTPVADGGEGTVEALVMATGGRLVEVDNITDPLGRKIKASFGILGDNKTAVIEMASASGLPLLAENERNPLKTSSYGTGELIREVLDRGFRKIIIGVGGSATTDGGVGTAQALGIRFYDSEGRIIERQATGADLRRIARIDFSMRDKRLDESEIIVACDVDNPLIGERGAARVYSPQKGATPEQVEVLEAGLTHLAEVIKNELGIDVAPLPGAGAAGGLAGGLVAFCSATLQPGAELVLDIIGFSNLLKDTELVITGEGALNQQTLYGKAPICVARRARKLNIPVLFLTGTIEEIPQAIYAEGITAVISIIDRPMSLAEAMQKTPELLSRTSEQIFNLIKALNP